MFSFLILSVVHPKSLHVRCHSKSSHFIFYIKYNLSLSFEGFSTVLSYSFVFYPCLNSSFLFSESWMPQPFCVTASTATCATGTVCTARPPEEVPGWMAISCLLHAGRYSYSEDTVHHQLPWLASWTLTAAAQTCRVPHSSHALPGWLLMLCIFDLLSMEVSHALDLVIPWLKAMSWHSRIFRGSNDLVHVECLIPALWGKMKKRYFLKYGFVRNKSPLMQEVHFQNGESREPEKAFWNQRINYSFFKVWNNNFKEK